jgi:hypothetical protein
MPGMVEKMNRLKVRNEKKEREFYVYKLVYLGKNTTCTKRTVISGKITKQSI